MSITPGQSREHATEQIRRLLGFVPFGEACERWIVAGSYRRLRPEVHDIDIVAIPGTTGGLFGDASNALWVALDAAMARGEISHPPRTCWGEMLRRFVFEFHVYEVTCCDATAWPVLVAVKTGPEKFTKGLVTRRCEGGLLPDDLTVAKDARGRSWRVWRGRVVAEGEDGLPIIVEPGQQLTFETEREFIELCCGKWIEPKERT